MGRMMLLCALLMACRSTPKASSLEDDPPEAATDTMPAQDEPDAPAAEVNLPEPDAGELSHLYAWVATQETGFELERLEDCEAQLLTRGDLVQTKSDMKKAADDLQADVRDTLPLYHWCYFHMLSRLEYQLEQQNLGRSWAEKLQQFLRESKALFVVAECLDRARQTNNYRRTLQKKYITLSQAWFGRNLSPLDATRSEPKKSAAPFEEK